MGMYSTGGRDAGSVATGDPQSHLWNPHSTKRLWVRAFSLVCTGTGVENVGFCRTTARGTAITTVTPDIDNAWERDEPPSSGVVLDLNWSVIPTIDTSRFWRLSWGTSTAAGTSTIEEVFNYPGIEVSPGSGLQLVSESGGISASDQTFTWFEE
jgi:hypothetical protein